MFSYLSPKQPVPADHPSRLIRQIVVTVLKPFSPLPGAMHAAGGSPSAPPKKLPRAILLRCLYSVRSERLLMKQFDYNLLFRWFVGLNMNDATWDVTVFSKNRERLLQADVARALFEEVSVLTRAHALLSDEHLTVDGTLLEARAEQKRLKPRTGSLAPSTDSDRRNPTVNFRGQKQTNDTHAPRPIPTVLVSESPGSGGGEIGVLGPRADGEPPRPGDRGTVDCGDGHCWAQSIAGGGARETKVQSRALHFGRRQGL